MKHVFVVTVMKSDESGASLESQGVFFSRGHAMRAHAEAADKFGEDLVNMNTTTVQFNNIRTFGSELWARCGNLRRGLLKIVNWR